MKPIYLIWLMMAVVLIPFCVVCCDHVQMPVRVPFLTVNTSAMSEEEKVLAVLDDVQKSMETKNVNRVLAHVADEYRDDQGRSKAVIKTQLTNFFKKYRTVKIERVVPKVVIQGNLARVVETFSTSAEPPDVSMMPPFSLEGQVAVRLQKSDSEWWIISWNAV